MGDVVAVTGGMHTHTGVGLLALMIGQNAGRIHMGQMRETCLPELLA